MTLAQALNMTGLVTSPTDLHGGQAFGVPWFGLKDPCVKCFAIYCNNIMGIPGTYDNRLYDCGEESWALKVRGGVTTL